MSFAWFVIVPPQSVWTSEVEVVERDVGDGGRSGKIKSREREAGRRQKGGGERGFDSAISSLRTSHVTAWSRFRRRCHASACSLGCLQCLPRVAAALASSDNNKSFTLRQLSTYGLISTAKMVGQIPLLAPLYLPGQEPLPPGVMPEEAEAYRQSLVYQKWMGYVPESCPFKVVFAGGAG